MGLLSKVFLCNPLHTLWYSRASFLHALAQVWAFIYLQLPWNSHICTCDSRDERTEKGKQKLGTVEICFILLEPWSFDQRKFPYLRLLDTAAAYFHCCCYCYTIFLFGCWDIGGEREVNPWGFLLFSLNVKRLFFFQARTRRLILECTWSGSMPTSRFQASLSPSQCIPAGENGKLTTVLVIFWVLVLFFNVLATTYFSNNSSMHSVQIL